MTKALSFQIYRTTQSTRERLKRLPAPRPQRDSSQPGTAILLDPSKRFQTHLGFGGAFTESAGYVFSKLKPAQQAALIKAYFDPRDGLGYTLCRTHMNSCDFSLGNYACADTPGDATLSRFSIDRERRYILPMLKAALKLTGRSMKLFISPWSPPAWMKSNREMNHGGTLLPRYRAAWALYYCRFVQALQREGIPVWGLSVQNEPEASQTWDSCLWTAEAERDFIRDQLGPTLTREKLAQLKIIIWDHNRDRLVERIKPVYDDPRAARYVWGAGFHWYCGDHFDNVQTAHDAYPDKQLLFTEGCQEGGPHINSWIPAERYARSMINDLNRWTVGWVDWNLLLDEQGGPNHVGNFCSAPVLGNTRTGRLMVQGSYYYIGHFSRFIRPGARRIVCASTHDLLESTAYINPDRSIATVVLNRSDKDIPFALKCGGQAIRIKSPARSIQTVVVK